MSIIYDALKKVEKISFTLKSGQLDSKKGHAESKVKLYILFGLLVCLGISVANIFFNLFSNPAKAGTKALGPRPLEIAPAVTALPDSEASKATEAKTEKENKDNLVSSASVVNKETLPLPSPSLEEGPKETTLPSLVLNGIFFTNEEVYALINNRIVREGDSVSGAVVKRIKLEEVDLEYEGASITLSTQAK